MRRFSLNKNDVIRSLRGTIYYSILDLKEIAFYFLIIIGVSLLVSVIGLIVSVINNKNSSVYSGTLNMGALAAVIMVIIIGVQMTTKKELRSSFIFPTDKKTYVLGNFIGMVINISLLILIASLFLVMEMLVIKTISNFNADFFFTSNITPANYLIGFWLSLTVLIIIYSLSFCLLAVKNKKLLVLIVVFILALAVFLPVIWQGLSNFVLFFVRPESVLLFSLKGWLLAFVLNILGYMLIKQREVF